MTPRAARTKALRRPVTREPNRIVVIACPACREPHAMILLTKKGKECGYCPRCRHTWDVPARR